MKNITKIIPALLAIVLIAAACGTEEPLPNPAPSGNDGASGGEEPDTPSVDGDWLLTAGTVDGASMNLNPDWAVTMLIDRSSIGGRAACNGYGGDVTIDGSSFSTGGIAITEMGCEPQIHEVESAFMNGLLKANTIARSGDTLSLTGDGVDFTFEIIPPVPTAELVGTTWVLDSLIQGEAVSSTFANADEATLLLNADGTFTGGTGCRTVSGEYVVNGGTLQFTSWGADGDCPADLNQQDSAVISVLEGPLTVEINEDRLTLTTQGGEGLSYKAR